jgi:hypothetical protein
MAIEPELTRQPFQHPCGSLGNLSLPAKNLVRSVCHHARARGESLGLGLRFQTVLAAHGWAAQGEHVSVVHEPVADGVGDVLRKETLGDGEKIKIYTASRS